MEIKLKKSKPLKIAYIKHRGAYDKIPFDKYFGELFAWLKEKRLRPAGPPIGLFYDDPNNVPAPKCRSEVGILIKGRVKPEKKIKFKEIPSTKVAAITHRGPMKDYMKTYEKLNEWISENNYVTAGPFMEIYLSKPKLVRGEPSIFSVVQVPVKKA
jgi:AraC family transcriptional regulator